MKILIPLVLLPLTCFAGPTNEPAYPALTTINFRGEELPVYAPPRLISPKESVAPRYPFKELMSEMDGQATVIFLVGTDGKVAEVNILSSTPTAGFGQAARAAIKHWHFEPQMREGQPTKFIVQQTVIFKSPTRTKVQGATMPIVPERYPYVEGFGRSP